MDELEIAGRRYLSTRRAGKEHRYHADYIGQLIRSGKVVGKKVGRSWYVEEESLITYLSGEIEKPKVVVKNVAPEAITEPKDEIQEEKIVEQKNFNAAPVRRVAVEETHRIPIHKTVASAGKTSGLRYVADDAPLLPEVGRKIATTVSMEVPAYESNYLPDVEEAAQKNISALSLATLTVVGVLTFSITAIASVAISFETVIEEGQVAGAGYTLK
jgi:hypothetical protein